MPTLNMWSELRPVGDGSGVARDLDLVWREDKLQTLLSTADAEVLFIAGCASNQVRFYSQFEHIVLLSAPADVMAWRLATRTNNPTASLLRTSSAR